MSYPRYGDESVTHEPYVLTVDEAERAEADRIATLIMERADWTSAGILTKGDAIWIAELLGRKDVADGIFRWFSTKGD